MPGPAEPQEVVLVVDVANVMGSVPDGWWRDRAGAATRLIASLAPMAGTVVTVAAAPGTVTISDIRAVVEGAARGVESMAGVAVLRAERDGDTEVVEEARRLSTAARTPLVVTADRGLRARLPANALVVGPGWLNKLLGR